MKIQFLFTPLLLLSGCERQIPASSGDNVERRLQTMDEKMQTLWAKLSDQERAIAEMKAAESAKSLQPSGPDWGKIETNLLDLQFQIWGASRKWVTIDPRQTGYQRIDSEPLPLLISAEKLESYLDGYRLELKIGNPYRMTLHGCTIDYQWNKAPDFTHADDIYRGSLKSNEVALAVSLKEGCWNSVTLTVCPASAEEITNLRVSMQSKEVWLSEAQ
jgi:hypothetical protein